jgi:hypothetical protein
MANRSKRWRNGLRSSDKLSEAEDAFLRHAQAILKGYLHRRHLKARPPFDNAEGFLKREAYSFLRITIGTKSGAKAIRSIVRRFVGEPKAPSYRENPYYWGLLAIDSGFDEVGPHRISRYAMQLQYAGKNHVPAMHLVGFLYQCRGSTDLAAKLRAKHRDPSLNLTLVQGSQGEI